MYRRCTTSGTQWVCYPWVICEILPEKWQKCIIHEQNLHSNSKGGEGDVCYLFKTLKWPNLLLVKFTKTNNFPPPTKKSLQNCAGLMILQAESKSQFLIRSKRTFRRKSMSSRYQRLQTQIFYFYEFYHGSCLRFHSHLSS